MKPKEKMERGVNSEEFTSLDQLDCGFQRSDGIGEDEDEDGLSPVSSQYSSCEESEFDRYCSANSVMGTPSVCSSMGFLNDGDSDFGSLKSLEGFSLGGGRVSRKFEEKSRSLLSGERGFVGRDSPNDAFCESKDEGKMEGVDNEESSSSRCNEMGVLGSKGGKVFDGEVGKKEDLTVLLKNVENVLLQGAAAARSAAENLLDLNHADELEDERCREMDETSSRYDHSEGEDSMFNYGSDDGSQPSAYYVKNAGEYHHEDGRCGNSLLMNSSVAFGTNDWEDFELDRLGNSEPLPNDFWLRQQSSCENEINSPDLALTRSISNSNFDWHEEERNERDVTTERDDLLGVDKSLEHSLSCSTTKIHTSKYVEAGATDVTGNVSGRCKQATSDDELDGLASCSVYDVFQKPCPPVHVVAEIGSTTSEKERKDSDTTSELASGYHDYPALQLGGDTLPDIVADDASNSSVDVHRDLRVNVLQGAQVNDPEKYVSSSTSTWAESEEEKIHGGSNQCGDQMTSSKGKDFEMDAFHDELVLDMEEILLESCDSSTRLKQRYISFQSEQSSPLRDGDSTACTSGFDDRNSLYNNPLRIDEIEVVGAKQRKGNIPLSERLVGVKEYTVYVIRVRSGKNQWEVERRYRDFYALYHQLKTSFAAREWILPPSWSSVDKESRKFFGNTSPAVIAERSTLIQECLSSILQSQYCSSPPSALISFLSPPEALLSSSQSNASMHQSNVDAHPSLGKTISLIVDIRSHKSVKELLDTQHYRCAGCHIQFDNGKTRMLEIVQTFGWGKPRSCEYTGQLFCSSCHSNETAVLPARVLHNWDFTPYPVSQMAKSYLDSIIDKPMLCVSAANPFLFSRVPALLHVVGVRRKIGAMLPYIRCSFRRSIYRRLGYRKYLLEANDFFALRDLIDLSKGAFAALPAILEAVLKKIQEHITELCLECCDNGIPCGARQACDNPSSLIFPFQDEIQRCKSCKSVFHKHCFNKLLECPCGAVLKRVDANESKSNLKLANAAGSSSFSVKKSVSRSSSGFLTGLFSFPSLEKGHKEKDNVILMGSLPSNSL